jgi:hypothetical protein
MYRAHAYDLSTPDIEELACSRINFEDQYEKYSGEERRTAYWDYDSETNRRYSEDDSNDDSSNEDWKTEPKRSSGYNSSESSSSSSSIKSKGKSSRKRKTKKKINLPKEDSKNNEKIIKLEEDLKELISKSESLSNSIKAYEKKNHQIEKNIKDLSNIKEAFSNESTELRSVMQSLIDKKEDVVQKNEVNRKRILSTIENMSNCIKAEASAREEFNDRLVEKHNKLELDLIKIREESTKQFPEISQTIREECKKSHPDIKKEITIPETKAFCQKISLAEKQEPTIDQCYVNNDNPAVEGQVTIPLNNQNHITPSTSVQKEQYENPKLGVNHQLKNSVSEEGNISKKVKVSKEETKTSLTEIALQNYFEYCQLTITSLFSLIIKMMSSNLMWGLLFTMLFHFSAADTTHLVEGRELRTISNGNLELTHTSGYSSPNISSIVIYTTATLISQSIIMNMSHVENDVTKNIINAKESIDVQKKICKQNQISCPMADLMIKKDTKTLNVFNGILRNLRKTCKNEDEDNDHLHLSNPIIYAGTIQGSSASHTMTATTQASALHHGHGLSKSEVPKRTNSIINVTQSTTGSWEAPEELSRNEQDILKLHFMPAINSILEDEKIEENSMLEKLSIETSTVVTLLVPTDPKSTHCATRLMTTTLLIPIPSQEPSVSITMKNNRLYQVGSDQDKYLLLPHDNVLSKNNLKPKKESYLMTRLCWADESIVANSSQSEDPLLQIFTVSSPNNISISERCSRTNSWSKREWILAPYTRFALPINCQISSRLLNCSAVKIKAEDGSVFHGLETIILEQDWEPRLPQGSSPSRGSLDLYILYTGGLLLITLMVYTGIRFLVKFTKNTYYGRKERPIITITPTIPSAPADQITAEVPTRTSRTIQDVNQLNSRMESYAKFKANSISQVLNLYEIMGPNITESTQNILDSYLEETLEGTDVFDEFTQSEAENLFNNAYSSDNVSSPSVSIIREMRHC